MAAPMATTSSGLTPLKGSFRKKSLTTSWTFGMRVIPPTRITSWMSDSGTPESLMHTSRTASPCAGYQVRHQPLELAPRDGLLQMQRPRLVRRDERQVHLRSASPTTASDLRLLRRLPDPLQRHLVLPQVHPRRLPEALQQGSPTACGLEVLPAQERVPVVAFTSNTPSDTSRIDTSNVPPHPGRTPPRSCPCPCSHPVRQRRRRR
eukprot:Sspe_Gene.829::Locus_280_Transcript_1_1_Confidence_1.000_Length_756::g.829::m.829